MKPGSVSSASISDVAFVVALAAAAALIFCFRVDFCFNDSCCSCCFSQTVSPSLQVDEADNMTQGNSALVCVRVRACASAAVRAIKSRLSDGRERASPSPSHLLRSLPSSENECAVCTCMSRSVHHRGSEAIRFHRDKRLEQIPFSEKQMGCFGAVALLKRGESASKER